MQFIFMEQPSVCYCTTSEEAKDISQFGEPHVHCPCEKCKGKATWRMTAWRHLSGYYNRITEESTNGHSIAKKHRVEDEFLDVSSDELSDYSIDNEISLDQDDEEDQDREERDQNPERSVNNADSNEMMKEFVEDAVLRLLEFKDKLCCSEKHFEELLKWGKSLHTSGHRDAAKYWPNNWNDVQILLKNIGFVSPKLFWICLRMYHPNHYGLMESEDEFCPHCGLTGNIPYYYLSLTEKVKSWCSCPEMCHKMTAHWRETNHWLPEEMKEGWGWHSKKEMWDGTRFAKLSYFWNPNAAWYLPVRCKFEGCINILSAVRIMKSPIKDDGVTRVILCQECGTSFEHIPVEVRGDPRNIAYSGHWDGWQPFASPFRGCGAIEVSIATMAKLDRCHKDELYVIGFVPNYLIPNKRSDSLDPFLEPMIRELEDGFIDGMQVDYKLPVAGIQPGKTIIRHLLLCWKGDHNGQCEAGKFVKCGKKACRRCNLESIWIQDSCHYYYPGFRKQGRYPSNAKCILENLETLKDIEQEERTSVKTGKAKESGYTGLSIFHRLYPLYGFLYDQDLVFDEMHVLYLNIVKHHIQLFLSNETGDFSGIDWQEVDKRLETFPWTHEYKTGRLPKAITKRFNFWKAEELSHFAFPAAEVCFFEMLDNSHYHILACMCRIVEYVVNHARSGWTASAASTFHEMCLRYGTLVEETYGINKCVITLHSLLHFYEDIQRFSSMDNYSCWTEERAVHHYIRKSNNHKNIEVTFALSESRRECLKIKRKNEVTTQGADKFSSDQAWAHSLSATKKLVKESRGSRVEDRLCQGILVGGYQLCEMEIQDRQKISAVKDVPIEDIAHIGRTARSLWKPNHSFSGLLYRTGDFAMFTHPEEGDTVVELRKFVSLKVSGFALVMCYAEEYTYCDILENGTRRVQSTRNIVLFEAELISRKIMVTQTYDEDQGQLKYTIIDYMSRLFPVTYGTVVIPYYPEEHDMVEVKGGDHGEKWKAHVIKFSLARKTIKARFFIHHATDQNKWIPENSPNQDIHFNSILSIAKGFWEAMYTCWIEED